MQSSLIRYKILAKRWIWLIVLGIAICGSASYVISKFIQPVYQASALIFLNMGSSNNTSPYENTSASLAALPTYAQLLTNHAVLNPVVAENKGLTLNQLGSMISVNPQINTQIIELDVKSTDPQQATQLANEVSQSFAEYANTQLPASVQILPADLPTTPVSPKSLTYAGLGALVGLGLALALIVIFEWADDRLISPEEAQEILGWDILTVIPSLSGKHRSIDAQKTPVLAEACRVLCASLNAAQTSKAFKLVMVTSSLAGEGKSTIAANLASFLAMAGKQVLLVDANLRHPALDQHFQLDNKQGLSRAFLEKGTPIEAELDGRLTEIPTLRVLTTGALPSNPPELLQAPLAHQLFDLLKKSSRFDYVILDTPPLLPVADTQILASYAQATVLVIDASKTSRKALLRAKRVLNRTHTRIIGAALNKSPWPDYDNIRQYLQNPQGRVQQPKVKFDASMVPYTPSVDSIHRDVPTTPPPNGKAVVDDADISIAIPMRDKDRGEKS